MLSGPCRLASPTPRLAHDPIAPYLPSYVIILVHDFLPGSANLREFTELASCRLRQRVSNSDPSSLSLRMIILGVFGRPATIPRGPTPLDILPPLLDCDTKSYQDLLKIYAHCVRYATCALFIALYGDGQTVLRGKDLKRKFPNQHR